MPEEDEPPVDAAVVGTAASMDPTGTTLVATVVAGALGVLVVAGRRVVRTFRPDRSGGPAADGSATDSPTRG